jgi:hypothetical protein
VGEKTAEQVTPTPVLSLDRMFPQLRVRRGNTGMALDILAAQLNVNLDVQEEIADSEIIVVTGENIRVRDFLDKLCSRNAWLWRADPEAGMIYIHYPEPDPSPTPTVHVGLGERVVSIQAMGWTLPQVFDAISEQCGANINGPSNAPCEPLFLWYQDKPVTAILDEICPPHGLRYTIVQEDIILQPQ